MSTQPATPAQPQAAPAGGGASNDKVLAAVSTLGLVGLIIYFAMPDASAYVKNYAKQGGMLFIVLMVGWVLGFVPVLGWLLSCLVSITSFVFWVLLVMNALQGNETYKLPVVGDLADQVFK